MTDCTMRNISVYASGGFAQKGWDETNSMAPNGSGDICCRAQPRGFVRDGMICCGFILH